LTLADFNPLRAKRFASHMAHVGLLEEHSGESLAGRLGKAGDLLKKALKQRPALCPSTDVFRIEMPFPKRSEPIDRRSFKFSGSHLPKVDHKEWICAAMDCRL